jgi:hypothetical protein
MLKFITKLCARTNPSSLLYLALATVAHVLYHYLLAHLPEVTAELRTDLAEAWSTNEDIRQKVLATA